MLIRRVSLLDGRCVDLRLSGSRIATLESGLSPRRGETCVEGQGHLLLPGLCDHHLHLYAMAAARASVDCGPPAVTNPEQLGAALRAAPGAGWVRGVGYHESVAGLPDRAQLDALCPDRPLRIQHRGGRLWLLNSRALERLGPLSRGDPPERSGGQLTGRLFDSDAWLRRRLAGQRPDLAGVGAALAARGVTSVTDTGPGNGPDDLAALGKARRSGALPQRLRLMGGAALRGCAEQGGVTPAQRKFHLLESRLPDLDDLVEEVRREHAAGRGVAFHCVTRVELVFALAALEASGAAADDRIEHAAVTPPDELAALARLGLRVVTQPALVATRGDSYLREVEAQDRPWLYRLRAFDEAGVALAGSSDAPHGDADPWCGMQAAVSRRTASGQLFGASEALSPERALALYLSPPEDPGGSPTQLAPGAEADLCLLDRDWASARRDLAAVGVRATWIGGRLVHSAPG